MPDATIAPPDHRRWTMLAISTLASAATCTFIYGMPLLLPALRQDEDLSLVGASLIVSAPVGGLLLTLVAWGAAADRWGERIVMAIGVSSAAVFLLLASIASGPVMLGVLLGFAGAAGGSVNAASGRLVMGWFVRGQRGLAMGVRQMAQPLGVAVAGVALPPLAKRWDVYTAMLFPGLLCAVVALAIVVVLRDPRREPQAPGVVVVSPYRGNVTLLRIHGASSLLVVPQFAVSAFTAAYLVGQRHWDPVEAGRLVAAFQLAGSGGRILSGVWSDRVDSRLRPMRQLGVLSALLMALIAVGAATHSVWIIVVFGVAAVVTVADNGLAYTSVAELAGTSWSGRALGLHNTTQNLASVMTAPLMALAIGETRYGLGFALVAVTPLLAVPLTPVRDEGLTLSQISLPEPEVRV